MISVCFNVLFFKEERSRKDRVNRSRKELKNKVFKVGKFLKQCTGCEREVEKIQWKNMKTE